MKIIELKYSKGNLKDSIIISSSYRQRCILSPILLLTEMIGLMKKNGVTQNVFAQLMRLLTESRSHIERETITYYSRIRMFLLIHPFFPNISFIYFYFCYIFPCVIFNFVACLYYAPNRDCIIRNIKKNSSFLEYSDNIVRFFDFFSSPNSCAHQ